MNSLPFRALIPMICLAVVLPCRAEHGFVLVLVQDTQHRPVRGVEIGVDGNGDSRRTDPDGKARLAVGSATIPGDGITLKIRHSPPGKDLVMYSPDDGRSQVPSFVDKPDNVVRVYVFQRGDRTALESGSVLASFAEKIIKANSPKSAGEARPPQDPKANFAAIAQQYGLKPDEIDQAIRAWADKTTDPYEAGLAALYERNYPKASAQLQDSLKQREEKLTADQKKVAEDQQQVADAAFFLGSSLYQQGKYRESAQAYERCLQLRPDDPVLLNNAALSLEGAGDYAGAEPLFRRALAIDEKVLGPNDPYVAAILNNLAILLQAKGDFAGAEPLCRRALAIDEKALGKDHPLVAVDLNSLALLLLAKGDDAGAELLFRRALAINEKMLGPNHPHVATALNNLALLLRTKGDFAGAEPLYRRALAIDEKVLGPDHPDVATALNGLAELHRTCGDFAGAEPLYRRALAIKEKALGPDHPDVAIALNNLALSLPAKGDNAETEALYRRALAIDEKALGPNHPSTVKIRANLDDWLEVKRQKEK
jgi:tetratricopeptide (TPR) repeat protein